MTPYYSDDHLTLYGGDCRAVMAELPAESVHTVVTSPPYWGLRDYGTATWEGGDEACDHEAARRAIGNSPSARSTLTTNNGRGPQPGDKFAAGSQHGYAHECPCGARRIDAQLGLEATPDEYVANMVAVFREVRRVLRADGTLWLNLGDSYASPSPGRTAEPHAKSTLHSVNENVRRSREGAMDKVRASGLKPKDLVGIPWRVAFALQADGWYLRSDIIWSKPNPMPESVTDRPTKAHEYLFLLSKQPRYYYDADAVAELAEGIPQRRLTTVAEQPGGAGRVAQGGHNPLSQGGAPTARDLARGDGERRRNLRSVWTIATEPYPGAHFATFPRKLVEPCVKAGTSERGVCPECGAPWVRVVERGELVGTDRGGNYAGREVPDDRVYRNPGTPGMSYQRETTGWRPSCGCSGDLANDWGTAVPPVPAVVLDPFAGSGTTLLVAQALGRRGVGIDLNPEYLRQALDRNRQAPLGLVG